MKTKIMIGAVVSVWSVVVFAEELTVTVYHQDLAVIKSTNEMTFLQGRQTVSYTGIPERIDPTSVMFVAEGGGVRVLEQKYRYDLVNSHMVFKKYIGKPISIVMEEGELVEGILQSVADDVVLKEESGEIRIVRFDGIAQYRFPELPEGLITKPTLFWDIVSDKALTAKTEVSYMTGGMDWYAEYTTVINEDKNAMKLASWVSVNNSSGAVYKDVKLKLVAGDVKRLAPEAPVTRDMMLMKATGAAEAEQGFEERALFEYHIYELQGKTTLDNAEIKQISLFPAVVTKAKKLLTYDARKNAKSVLVSMEFINAEKDGLGMPLPAGTVRVFKQDRDGSLEFIGEDRLNHTPKNEKVRLSLGSAFDIAAERKVIEIKRISDSVREETVEILLRNRKDSSVEVTAVEHFRGDWTIMQQTDTFVKKDAYTAECTVTISANAEITIRYTVRYR